MVLRARLKQTRRPLQSEEKPALPALLAQLVQLDPLAQKVKKVIRVILDHKVLEVIKALLEKKD